MGLGSNFCVCCIFLYIILAKLALTGCEERKVMKSVVLEREKLLKKRRQVEEQQVVKVFEVEMRKSGIF